MTVKPVGLELLAAFSSPPTQSLSEPELWEHHSDSEIGLQGLLLSKCPFSGLNLHTAGMERNSQPSQDVTPAVITAVWVRG